jgi:citrate lyase subunit gamma (acyl carrier protein)
MKIQKIGIAGTMESSDIMVTLMEKGEKGINILLDSPVEEQYGRRIKDVIRETLTNLGLENVTVTAVDKGALDCVIRARVETAAYRACGNEDYVWGGKKE